ncbi:MAG TPA: hypothetical protein ACFYEM_06995 [Candidatus Hypogeohydataceae bacterium YC40]
MVKVKEVHFNYDQNSATADALNIRKNQTIGTLIQAPEWREGQPSQPAAYAVNALGNIVRIKAKFSNGPEKGTLKIRAIDAYMPPPEPSGCLGWLVYWLLLISQAIFGNVLGNVKEKDVAFNAQGNSGLEEFELVNHRLKQSGVGIHTTTWKWQFKQGNQWVDFGTTDHKVYLVLDIPAGPWQQQVMSGGMENTQLPWVDALEVACAWALGATTKGMAARKITEGLNANSLLSYNPITFFGSSPYFLSSFLGQLKAGNPFQLNCRDCADAVTTLSNLLGCDLWEGVMQSLNTRKILGIGGNAAVELDWKNWSWGWHEVAWLHAIGQNEHVYDGCLQLDMDNNYNDLVHIAHLPIKMKFGQNDPNDYRYRLVESNPCTLENVPRRRQVA